MNDEMRTAQAAIDALFQDLCADGIHGFTYGWHDGLRRCRCGAVHPDDLARALGDV